MATPSLRLYQDTSRQLLVEQIDTFVNNFYANMSLRYSTEDRKVRYSRSHENAYGGLCGASDEVLLIEREWTPTIEKRLRIFLNKAMAVTLAPTHENIRQAQRTLDNLFIDGEHPFDRQQVEPSPLRIRRTLPPPTEISIVSEPEPATEDARLTSALERLARSTGAEESMRNFAESLAQVSEVILNARTSEPEPESEDSPERDAFIAKIDALLAEDDDESLNDDDRLPKAAPTR